MKKYYFMDTSKTWLGPFQYPQILFFCLNGTIQPQTYVWHNKLVANIGIHPLESIYARKYASEFRSLPFWVFQLNIKILLINSLNKLKKRFRRKDSWERFVEIPIETPPILEGARRLFLVPSIVALNDFIAPGDFKVRLSFFDLDNDKSLKTTEYPIMLISDNEPGIKFEITMTNPPSVGGVEHKESYGLHRKLILTRSSGNIEIRANNVVNFSTRFPYKPQILKGRFQQANNITDNNYINLYNRLILAIEDDKPLAPQDIIQRSENHLYDYDEFNIRESLMGLSFKSGGCYINVIIDKIDYRFYSIKEKLLVIDGCSQEDLSSFRIKAEIIRIAYAILSGKFYGGSCNYISSIDSTFQSVEGIWVEIEKPAVISNRRSLDIRTFRTTINDEQLKDYESINKLITPELFSALCEMLYKDEKLLRVAELIISGMEIDDPLQQGALYSVALETLTSVLSDKGDKGLKPIVDDALSSALIADLNKTLSDHKGNIAEEGFNILQKKIGTLNNPTNQDKLVRTFEVLGISLSEKDKKTIGKRNDYLHGRSPLKSKLIFELNQISLRLHSLIVCLILKHAGYTGHIINLDIHSYYKDEQKAIEVSLDIAKRIQSLSGQISSALKSKKKSKIRKIQLELKQLQDHEINDLIRII